MDFSIEEGDLAFKHLCPAFLTSAEVTPRVEGMWGPTRKGVPWRGCNRELCSGGCEPSRAGRLLTRMAGLMLLQELILNPTQANPHGTDHNGWAALASRKSITSLREGKGREGKPLLGCLVEIQTLVLLTIVCTCLLVLAGMGMGQGWDEVLVRDQVIMKASKQEIRSIYFNTADRSRREHLNFSIFTVCL